MDKMTNLCYVCFTTIKKMIEKLTQFESNKDDRGKPTQILSGRVYLQYRCSTPRNKSQMSRSS